MIVRKSKGIYMVTITKSPNATEEAGYQFGLTLANESRIVGLYGDLVSGKTCFIKGAARALRVTTGVSSPTYSLVNVYSAPRSVTHIDAYRLKSPDELIRIGFEDYVASEGICFIEWADKVEALLPRNTTRIRFKTLSENEREITIEH